MAEHDQLPPAPLVETSLAPAAPSTAADVPAALADDGPAPAAGSGGGDDADGEGDDEEAAGEDKGVDYRLLAKLGKKSAGSGIVIPKRGEKDFEPLELGVNIQERALNQGREAMFGALTGTRGGSSKSMSHAHFPYPSSSSSSPAYPSALPYVLLARGNHFATMGHTLRPSPPLTTTNPTSSPSTASSSAPTPPVPTAQKEPVTVLLPEEALYLLERGSLTIWRGDMGLDAIGEAKARDLEKEKKEGKDGLVEEVFARASVRMTVQEGWAAWGEELKGGRYTVYAQLKRQGYIVHRAPAHLPTHLRPAPVPAPSTPSAPVLPKMSFGRSVASVGLGIIRLPFTLWHGLITFWRRLFDVRIPTADEEALLDAKMEKKMGKGGGKEVVVDPWTPLIHRRAKVPQTYGQIFSHLRIIPSPTALPAPPTLTTSASADTEQEENPYDIYYNVWRPNGSYRKSRPSEPDFRVGVVDARLHPLPSLPSFFSIFSRLPTLSAPPPRIFPNRPPRPQQNPNYVPRPPPAAPSWLYRALVWLRVLPDEKKQEKNGGVDGEEEAKGKMGNPFPFLKQGDRGFILAVVDGGTVSWVKFGRGVFGGWAVQ